MEMTQYRRHRSATMHGGASPHLLRSKSGSTVATSKGEETKAKKKRREGSGGAAAGSSGDGGLVRFLPRSVSKREEEVPAKRRSGSTSPSAWALSPGRSPSFSSPAAAVVPKTPARSDEKFMKKEGKGGGGGVGGVLKYFRQKKVSPLLEEEYHQYRVAYNRLLQWRFANARAEASMAAVKRMAQEKVLSRWVRISVMRKLTAEKRFEIEKQKQEMKVYQVLKWEMGLLNEWRKIEAKNMEAVGRVVRKLSAISHCLPLHHNAQGDVMSVYDAISTAEGVMDNIQSMILGIHLQVEKTCFLLTELLVMLKQHKQFLPQLQTRVTLLASLEAEEKSLRVHHIQLLKQVNGPICAPLSKLQKYP